MKGSDLFLHENTVVFRQLTEVTEDNHNYPQDGRAGGQNMNTWPLQYKHTEDM